MKNNKVQQSPSPTFASVLTAMESALNQIAMLADMLGGQRDALILSSEGVVGLVDTLSDIQAKIGVATGNLVQWEHSLHPSAKSTPSGHAEAV